MGTTTRESDADESPVWLTTDSADIAELDRLLARRSQAATVPLAREVVHEIPVYAAEDVASTAKACDLAAEWNHVLATGAGVFVVRSAWSDEVLDRASIVFERIIAEQGAGAGDHFAAAGSNARIWNAHEKLAIADPEAYLDYASNETLALASLAWLGPGYQVTAQVNLVRPGGSAQAPHRDYHMGFQSADMLARYPATVHRASASLTLQGGVAHVDVPLDSGPTQLLPFSQAWLPGYLASAREDVRTRFAQACVQVPLEKGDALFFNPALLHAAGDNRTTDVQRLVNLFQVSCAYGRAMELLDRARMVRAVYPTLWTRTADQSMDDAAVERAIAATAEGYAFPANLELEPPVGGLAPPSQQDLARRALAERWTVQQLDAELTAQAHAKRSC